jgi:hypothetical protein
MNDHQSMNSDDNSASTTARSSRRRVQRAVRTRGRGSSRDSQQPVRIRFHFDNVSGAEGDGKRRVLDHL